MFKFLSAAVLSLACAAASPRPHRDPPTRSSVPGRRLPATQSPTNPSLLSMLRIGWHHSKNDRVVKPAPTGQHRPASAVPKSRPMAALRKELAA